MSSGAVDTIGAISCALFIICAVIGFLHLAECMTRRKSPEEQPRVGDVYTDSGEGKKDDPDANPKPWVSIWTILELRSGKAKLARYYMHGDGKVFGGEEWTDAKYLPRRTKLYSGTEEDKKHESQAVQAE